MFDPVPPCGIGGSETDTGPCTGSSGHAAASQAGSGVFTHLSPGAPISAIIGAGALLAGVIFAVWATMTVGTFFSARSKRIKQRDAADAKAFKRFSDGHWKEFDTEGFGRNINEVNAAYSDIRDAATWDSEDDNEDDRLLEHDDEEREDAK